MATKIFCDGCGSDISSRKLKRVTVNLDASNVGITILCFDLCERCHATFCGRSLPTQWPRAEPNEAA